jgi:uncharacterized damage-inducible protein DinB
MIGIAYVQRMAQYNRWQNENLYGAADRLGDAERRADRGAFFGSIHGTLSHLIWGDRLWLSRFDGRPSPPGGIPESPSLHPEWRSLKAARSALDGEIEHWASGLTADWLASDLTYFSQSANRDMSAPRWMFVTHFFNHQTHHRGQVHCLLTQAGAKPHDTDLVMMPDQQ